MHSAPEAVRKWRWEADGVHLSPHVRARAPLALPANCAPRQPRSAPTALRATPHTTRRTTSAPVAHHAPHCSRTTPRTVPAPRPGPPKLDPIPHPVPDPATRMPPLMLPALHPENRLPLPGPDRLRSAPRWRPRPRPHHSRTIPAPCPHHHRTMTRTNSAPPPRGPPSWRPPCLRRWPRTPAWPPPVRAPPCPGRTSSARPCCRRARLPQPLASSPTPRLLPAYSCTISHHSAPFRAITHHSEPTRSVPHHSARCRTAPSRLAITRRPNFRSRDAKRGVVLPPRPA